MQPARATNPFLRQFAIVFCLWTLIALCGGLAAYGFDVAVGSHPSFIEAFRRPLIEQWIWAALTPFVFHCAGRFPLGRPDWKRMLGIHAACFVLLSLVHCAVAELVGGPLASVPAGYPGSRLVLRFLEEFYSDIWMYWPLVCIRALMDAHARERERERHAAALEKLVAQSQLSLLRAQIQPHFLFNTLHAITTLLRVDARAAEDMVADLSQILRASFAGPAAQEVALGEELELTRCYLRIQRRRLGKRLQVEIDIDAAAADAFVPALVLQSLVENAVVHGIAPLPRGGHVQVRARREGEQLCVCVRDDGVGLSAPRRDGVGLVNARQRLERLYGAAQSLELTGLPGGGTVASLCVPYRCGAAGVAAGAKDHEDDPHLDRGRRTARPAEPVDAAGARA